MLSRRPLIPALLSRHLWQRTRATTFDAMARTKKKGRESALPGQGPSATDKTEQDPGEDAEEKPPAKKARKPTKRQLEDADAAARPIYDESSRPSPLQGAALRIVTWNVASLRSTLNKDPEAIKRLASQEQADVVCIQETKLQTSALDEFSAKIDLPSWHHYWNCSESKKGYSGTATFTRQEPQSVAMGMSKAADHDTEGRLITLEFDACYLLNVYTPNSGDALQRLEYRVQEWDRVFAEYVGDLQKNKPVVITGDLNCAHREIDIHSPRTNKKSAGFTQDERDSFGKNLEDLDLIDCFRHQYPDSVGYTYWSIRSNARAKNKGWRLDYFLASNALRNSLYDCSILKSYQEEEKLSDHCPIGLVLKL